MSEFELYLYVAGETAQSLATAGAIKSLLNSELEGRYFLEIINVLDRPQRAEKDGVLATPTLVKVMPPPEKRIVGDLSDTEKVSAVLCLTAEQPISSASLSGQ